MDPDIFLLVLPVLLRQSQGILVLEARVELVVLLVIPLVAGVVLACKVADVGLPLLVVQVSKKLGRLLDFSTVVPVEFAVARRVRGWFVSRPVWFVRQWVGRGSTRNSSV